MAVSIKINKSVVAAIAKAQREAAVETMELLNADLIASETMPFDNGDMQNNQTFVEPTEDGAVLITGSPQARRLYYHPEYNFQHKNANAGAAWLEPYISGEKKDFIQNTYAEVLKRKL